MEVGGGLRKLLHPLQFAFRLLADVVGQVGFLESLAQLSGLGARGDGNRLAELIRAHGGETPRTWRRGRRGYGNQLSPRELEVVRQLVTGRTNREIADALSRSPKTVAGQLSSAMRKLGVTSRTALAVAVMDAGLVPADPSDPGPRTGGAAPPA